MRKSARERAWWTLDRSIGEDGHHVERERGGGRGGAGRHGGRCRTRETLLVLEDRRLPLEATLRLCELVRETGGRHGGCVRSESEREGGSASVAQRQRELGSDEGQYKLYCKAQVCALSA
jgi:hypothetical protein